MKKIARTLLELRDILNDMPEHQLMSDIEVVIPEYDEPFHLRDMMVVVSYGDTIIDMDYVPVEDKDDSQSEAEFGSMNINTASAEELEKLPGIGEKSAKTIVEGRSEGPYTDKSQITRLDGIGKGIYRMVKDLITT